MQQPATGRRGRRLVLCPIGTHVGGSPVDVLSVGSRRADEPLVRLATRVGEVTTVRQQAFRVRRQGGPGEPFHEPKWVPAVAVRPGDYLFRPAGVGQAEWFPVREVAHLLPDGPLYAVETDDETIVVNGFLAQSQPPYG